MTFSISTHWIAGRSHSGEDMIKQILDIGFDSVELGYDTTLDLVPDIKRLVSAGTIRVSSLHNYCPVPVGAPYGHPELFPLTGLDNRNRQSAILHTKRTIEFAAELGANAVVVHVGNVDMKHMTRDLIELCLKGQQFSPEYDKIKLKLMMNRDKKVQDHLDQLYRSLDEIIPFLSQHKIKMGIENLPSWESIPCETEMEEIFRRFDSPFLGYWHDMGHGQIRQNLGFIGHKRWFERLSGKLFGMHIHDVAPPAQDHIMPPSGKINFQDFKNGIHSDTILVFEPAPGTAAAEIIEGKKIVAQAWDSLR